MKRNVIFLFFVVSVLFCTKNSYAQVLQKKADKWQLINGVKLGPGVKKQNLNSKKVNTSSVLIKSNKNSHIRKNKYKVVKPPKSLKYGNQKPLNSIRKEDE
mgnify:CR=1 FL=1|tara:strand:- start:320 stop:622 length:303 start_codon:yes stop_codon:yes gene_type:complete